ncbi:MAG: hypothetical protein P9L90_04000 [Candidatus Aadella gelida]|nr:hypothetical protein [Candidatus Aadella gelida]
MEMKDLLKIEKLSKKDRVFSALLAIGIIVLILILLSNSGKREKSKSKEIKNVAEQAGKPEVIVQKGYRKKPYMSSSDKKDITIGMGRDNPFIPPKSGSNEQGKYTSGFRLEGVTMDSEGKLMAIINDEIIGVGGIIGGGEVISIEKEEVVIKKDDEEHILRLWSDRALQ